MRSQPRPPRLPPAPRNHRRRSGGEAQGAGSPVHALGRRGAGDAQGAGHLDGAIDDSLHRGGDEDLDGRDIGARILAALDDACGVDGHQPRGLNIHIAVGDKALNKLFGFQQAAVNLPLRSALDHQVKGPPHLADTVHAVVDPARAGAVLCGGVPGPTAAEGIFLGYTDIVVSDFAVTAAGMSPHRNIPDVLKTF